MEEREGGARKRVERAKRAGGKVREGDKKYA